MSAMQSSGSSESINSLNCNGVKQDMNGFCSSPNSGSHRNGLSLAKTGRKGDPRMHLAVAARLSDPSVSLYEALVKGGFDYPHDDDCNLVDSENVTLGQRKNQLSRRVRLARRSRRRLSSSNSAESKLEVQASREGDKIEPSIQRSGMHVTTSVKSSSGYLKQQSQQTYNEQEDGGDSENYMTNDEGNDEGTQSDNSGGESPQRGKQLLAKFHPEFQPFRVLPCQKTNKIEQDTLNGNRNGAIHQELQKPQFKLQVGHNGNIPTNNRNDMSINMCIDGSRQSSSNMLSALQAQHQAALNSAAAVGFNNCLGAQSLLFSTSSNVGHLSNPLLALQANATSTQAQRPKPASGVAIASLANTAATAGMTLEQLAVALQNSRNLSQVLLSSKTPTMEQTRRDLAVALYQSENLALYQRVMLLSGYAPEAVMNEVTSPEYLQFVLACWEAEGNRLQKLITHQKQHQPRQQSSQNRLQPP